jgi:hypothetical protein
MIIDHTEVNEHKGEGVGKQLVDAAVAYARQHGIKIMPVCSFAQALLENNSDYADVLYEPGSASELTSGSGSNPTPGPSTEPAPGS